MPQDIPLEASEVLAFTPASLEALEDAPVFRLRAPSSRDKRFHRRLLVEEGIAFHDHQAIRAEVLKGLEQMWDAEIFEQQVPVVKAYWEARDDYDAQLKDDPALVWNYDKAIEEAVNRLLHNIRQSWPPLRRMLADNSEYGNLAAPMLVAVTVKGFTNLPVSARLERGYLTVETAESIEDALAACEAQHGLEEGNAWSELTVACSRRMYLDRSEVGNSESQSQSPTAPVLSNEKITSEKAGKSQASARSKKTRATG